MPFLNNYKKQPLKFVTIEFANESKVPKEDIPS